MVKENDRRFSTDTMAKSLWLCLVRDFQNILGPDFLEGATNSLLQGVPAFRKYTFPLLPEGVSPFIFKAQVQMQSLLKKYMFTHDLYTPSDLESQAFRSFTDFQVKLNMPRKPLSEITFRVLQEARKIAKEVLGPFDPEAVSANVRFGKKSSIGCPFNLAYLDHKLTQVRAFTGSTEGTDWFFGRYLETDPILCRIVKRLLRCSEDADLSHDSLNLINVPKAWNKLRPITPLTLLTLFYSFGVGGYMSKRLKTVRLDISHLQKRHRGMLKKMSVTLRQVTLDVTRASDSILSEHLNRVLPRKWYQAVMKSAVRQLYIDGVPTYTGSVLPMGNGLTFPCETLVFYSVIKAIGNLSNVRGIYSAYGDDLIYPSEIHSRVVRVFTELGWMPNLEKTFCKTPFRESCGEDYFRGCPVRPFVLGEEQGELTRTQYLAVLYKTYNGLVRRWDPVEIPKALSYLLSEITTTGLPVSRVPPQFPDHSGIKVLSPWDYPCGCRLVDYHPLLKKFENGSRWFTFSYLAQTSKNRFVLDQTPYYWQSLLPDADSDESHSGNTGVDYSIPPKGGSALRFVRTKRKREYRDSRGKIKTRMITGWKPVVDAIGTSTILVRTASVSDWL